MTLPLVSIGALSWNRLHYLRAMIDSAHDCIQYPHLEWILSDNESTEDGLREYINKLDFVDFKIFRRQGHADAMNQIVDMARGKYLMLLPDDIQFVIRGNWLSEMIELLERHEWIGSIVLSFNRRMRNQGHFGWRRLDYKKITKELLRYGRNFRLPRVVRSQRGYQLHSLGWQVPGVNPAGLLTLTRTNVWKNLGPWRINIGHEDIVDSSLGAENYMFARAVESKTQLHRMMPFLAVAASIVTDPTGTSAKVRNGYRYGVYFPPPKSPYYYRILDLTSFPSPSGGIPLGFEDVVEPLGFELPLDQHGNLKKSSINLEVRSPV